MKLVSSELDKASTIYTVNNAGCMAFRNTSAAKLFALERESSQVVKSIVFIFFSTGDKIRLDSFFKTSDSPRQGLLFCFLYFILFLFFLAEHRKEKGKKIEPNTSLYFGERT